MLSSAIVPSRRLALPGIGFDLRVEVALDLHKALVRLLEPVGQDRRLLQERLAVRRIGRPSGEILEGIEEIIERRGDAAAGRGTGGVERRAAVNVLAQRGLAAGAGLLHGLGKAAERDLAHELAVEQVVAQLLHGEHLQPQALRPLRREHRAAVAIDHALARVVRVADVREIPAGGLDGPAMGRQRHDAGVESGEEAGHGGWGKSSE